MTVLSSLLVLIAPITNCRQVLTVEESSRTAQPPLDGRRSLAPSLRAFPFAILMRELTIARAGGYLSTLRDMSVMGKAILSSNLLSKSVTDRW